MIPIYLLSLPTDWERREKLRSYFGRAWDWLNIVDAVDSQDLPAQLLAQCNGNNRKPLGPREIAVAMSHMEILKRFIQTDAHACIVFEDDVVGESEAVTKAAKLVELMSGNSFMLLGGQQGLRNRRFVYGRKTKFGDMTCWELPRPSWRFTSRACCYALTRYAAQQILSQQHLCLDRADNWSRLFRPIERVFMTNLFEHPVDLSHSYIESERRRITSRPLLQRVAADGLPYTLETTAIKGIWPVIARFYGLELVPEALVT